MAQWLVPAKWGTVLFVRLFTYRRSLFLWIILLLFLMTF
jgi:hypothetical protein